jgi:hypothetical protein
LTSAWNRILRQSEATLTYSRAKLAETAVKSPISGVVVFKALEKGETVSPGPTILTFVDVDNLYIRVDLEETIIGSIALNSEASIRTEGAPDRIFKGTVSEIGRYAEFATQKDVSKGRQDIKTFKVKITVSDSGGFLKPGLNHGTHDAKTHTNHQLSPGLLITKDPSSLNCRPRSRGLLSRPNQSYFMQNPWPMATRSKGDPENRIW